MSHNVHTLDARNLSCPLPIIRTQKAISQMAPGDILEIIATDPGSAKDLNAFCSQTGNEMLSIEQGSDELHFRIRKA